MNVGAFGTQTWAGTPITIGPIECSFFKDNLGPSRFSVWTNGLLEDFTLAEDYEVE